MTNAEIVENARRTLYGHDPNEPFSSVEIGQISAALGVARIVLRARHETEKNAPLTLDELREMEGEPVWVVVNTGIDPLSFWALVEVCEASIWLTNNLGGRSEYGADAEFEADCVTLYRRKPEEDTDLSCRNRMVSTMTNADHLSQRRKTL